MDNPGFTVFPDVLKNHSAVILRVKQSKTEALQSFKTSKSMYQMKQRNIPEWCSPTPTPQCKTPPTPSPMYPLAQTKHLHVPTGTGNINNILFVLF
jgi:hypothetical protein